MKKIIYQGAPGSFSHSTGVAVFGARNIFVGVHHFNEIFEAVKKEDPNLIPHVKLCYAFGLRISETLGFSKMKFLGG